MRRVRTKVWFPGIMVLVLTATMVHAEDKIPRLRLVINVNTVDVFDDADRLMQSLPFTAENPTEENREYFAIAEDMNFDGYPDVRILFSQGNVNTYYDCWLWCPSTKAFVYNEPMQRLSNPVFDRDSQSISIYERGSAVCYVEGRLGWDGENLVWQEQSLSDAADDGENIVLSRYQRGSDGELRLVFKTTRPIKDGNDSPFESIDDAYYHPDVSGLNLILDLPADPLDVAVLPNGEWWMHKGLPNRELLFEQRRLPGLEFDPESARRLVRLGWPQAREIRVEAFTTLGVQTSYPAFKVEFLAGENEDTRQFVAALVFTDQWSFWFVLEASVDAVLDPDAEADEDADTRNLRLRKDMEKILLNIQAIEPASGDFLPSFGIPVYLAGDESTLPVSVMDALIRIKKIITPECAPRAESEQIAYRYDGVGTVAGCPALLFSYGSDSWEKFTAERHFAVDAQGVVYEMDGVDGGEYWRWEDGGTPFWWGEYRQGNAVLSISNYRQGPVSMYFVYEINSGENTVSEGTAMVRGRRAYYGPFVFSLSNDNASVEITLESEATVDPEFEEDIRLIGHYGRE